MLAPLLSLLVALDAVAAVNLSSKRFLDTATHEERARVPSGWVKRTDSARGKRSLNVEVPALDKKSFKIPLKIHLAQRNLEHADAFLMDVSDPTSPNYGNHWTPTQIINAFSPTEEAVEDVLEWLLDAGFSGSRVKYAKPQGTVTVDLTLAEAEQLLDAEYELYDHAGASRPQIACTKYSIPKSVKHHVDFVTPTLHFDVPLNRRTEKRNVDSGVGKLVGKPSNSGSYPVNLHSDGTIKTISTELSQCDAHITPVCLEALYKFSPNTQLASKKNSFGIVEYTPQAYIPSDLDLFARNFTPKAFGYRPYLASIDGGSLVPDTPNFDDNGESNLDLTFGIALTYPVNITLYQVGDANNGASFNNLLDALDASYCTSGGGDDPTQDGVYPDPKGGYQGKEDCGGFKLTHVISTSYGYNEADLTPYYEQRQCNEYLKLGLLGTTVLYSSGDYGVAGNENQCIIPSTGAYGNGTDAIKFNPSFPGGCPYVTSVGATQVNPNSTIYEPESACEQVIYSGGGFSNVFPMPSYQEAAVKNYFAKHKPTYSSAQYNNSQTTRGFPDISANGANYAVPVGGTWHRVFGTSASSPVVGSIITLLNDARIAIGKKPLGFINPALYANAWALNDITSGGNQGCNTPGFTAVPGWDPVTGLGTPNFPKLVEALVAL